MCIILQGMKILKLLTVSKLSVSVFYVGLLHYYITRAILIHMDATNSLRVYQFEKVNKINIRLIYFPSIRFLFFIKISKIILFSGLKFVHFVYGV